MEQARVPNHLRLLAVLQRKDVLRFSPAGVPILDCELLHHSEQVEAKVNRQVEMVIVAQAAGAMAEQLNAHQVGSQLQLSGFLAPRRKLAKTLVFHITQLEQFDAN
jgi:primosomal replication protein N